MPRPDPANPQAAISLARPNDAAMWGLHPALEDTMLPLWQRGQLAFVPFAGTKISRGATSRHRTASRAACRSRRAGAAPHTYGSGFLNRLAGALDGTAAPVAFTDGLPVVMTGDVVVPNVSLKGTGRAPFDDRQMALLAGMYAGTRFEPLIAEGFDLRQDRRRAGAAAHGDGRRRTCRPK